MKKMMICVWGCIALPLSSSVAFASAGHDHSHWSSSFVHLFIVGVVLAVTWMALRVLKKRALKKRVDTKKGQAYTGPAPFELND